MTGDGDEQLVRPTFTAKEIAVLARPNQNNLWLQLQINYRLLVDVHASRRFLGLFPAFFPNYRLYLSNAHPDIVPLGLFPWPTKRFETFPHACLAHFIVTRSSCRLLGNASASVVLPRSFKQTVALRFSTGQHRFTGTQLAGVADNCETSHGHRCVRITKIV